MAIPRGCSTMMFDNEIKRGNLVMIKCKSQSASSSGKFVKSIRDKTWAEQGIDFSTAESAMMSLLKCIGVEETDAKNNDSDSTNGNNTTTDNNNNGTGNSKEGSNKRDNKDSISWGTVIDSNYDDKTAVVTIWRRGDSFFVGSEGRPRETVALSRLVKVSNAVFWKNCRKGFMSESGQYLKLKGEGHDESVPLSLIAYNNKIINQLIEKTDTGKKVVTQRDATSRGKVLGGLKTKLNILKEHNPSTRDPKDPFSEVRDQLEALSSLGISTKVKKGREGIRQRMAQRSLLQSVDEEAPDSPSQNDFSYQLKEDGSSQVGKVLSAKQSQAMGYLRETFTERKREMANSLSIREKLLGIDAVGEFYKSTDSHQREPKPSRPQSRTPRKNMDLDISDDIEIKGVVLSAGSKTILIETEDGSELQIKLARVVYDGVNGIVRTLNQMLRQKEVIITPVGENTKSDLFDVRLVKGKSVQEELISSGKAYLTCNELEDSTSRLFQLQQQAISSHLGVWSSENKITIKSEGRSVQPWGQLPSLFDKFFASQEYLALSAGPSMSGPVRTLKPLTPVSKNLL